LNDLLEWALNTKHATYSFALYRIIYGLIVLAVLATSFTDRHYLWGVGSRFIDPVATNRGYPWFFDMVFSKHDAALFDLAYLLLAFLAVLFTAGWRTRVVAPLLLLFWIGLSTNSTVLTNGGDTLMRITLFFALFADLGGRWSLDALRRRRQPSPKRRARSRIPEWATTLAHNTALVLCAYQILLVYATSGLLKLQGEEWVRGTATYYALSLDVFRPIPWLNDLFTVWDAPVLIATAMTVGLQLLFPVFLMWRPTRIVAILGVTGIHAGIGLMLGLWPFSLIMIALDILFVRDSTWRWMLSVARSWVSKEGRAEQAVEHAAPEGALDGVPSGSAANEQLETAGRRDRP